MTMKAIRFTSAALLGLVYILAHGTLHAQEPKLYVLLVIDTKADKDFDQDRKHIENLLGEGIGGNRLKITTFVEEKVTRDRILKHYDNHPATANDTVMLFYSGHGGTTREDVKPRDHIFQLSGGPRKELLYRSELRRAMQNTGARLVILLSDSCSEFTAFTAPPSADREIVVKPIRDPNAVLPGYRRLFFEARGVVDVNSSREGTYSFSDQYGSIFARTLPSCFDNFKHNPQVTWIEFYAHMHGKSEREFKEWKRKTIQEYMVKNAWRPETSQPQKILDEQPTQEPQAFYLPGVSLGLVGQGTDGEGILIRNFTRDSRAKASGLQVGDRIVAVNGTRIKYKKDFDEAIDPLLAHGVAQIRMAVNRQGTEMTITVSLTR
jgi:hypothetical protein